MSYSGFTRTELENSAGAGRQRLFSQLDILIDGPYVANLSASLLWRGSSNQQIHFLTERHRDLLPSLADRSAGVEVHLNTKGELFWAGVPEPGFQNILARGLRGRGLEVLEVDGVWA
jgi:anaerobic ribonucleoside-triphosphate reductase activating protein